MTDALWTPAAGAEIGVDWIEHAIAPAAEFGRRARARERPYRRGQEREARERIENVAALARAVSAETLAAVSEAIAGCPDPSAAVARARAGGVLADADLFELQRFCDALARVGEFASVSAFPAEFSLPDPGFAALLEVGRTTTRAFYLSDAYDGELARARAGMTVSQTRYDAERSRLVSVIAAYAGVNHVRDGEFVLMRDRTAGPLPPGIRVLREAPTYVLCEVALDEPALAALAELDAAQVEVGELEERVRARLSAHVADSASRVETAIDTLGALDSLVARARFAQRYETCSPEIIETPAMSFVDARLLPLSQELSRHGHHYVPLSIELDGVAVLTGPNMGGKTAALRTCGFLAACVALGVPVPARAARVPLFDEIAWIGAGVEDGRASLLSSFGREVAQLRDFLGRGAGRPLVLVDEFARTTSPREGRGLLIALLERLRDRGALALAATHLSKIASDARVAHYAVAGLRELPESRTEGPLDLDAAIESIAQVMDFRVARVDEDAVPRADALALAEVLGLDPELVARARAVL